MTTVNFKGFNTIDQPKKFGLTDFKLIKRDLLNAFLIRYGQLPGRPDIGTKIWDFVFEPLDDIVRDEIEEEVRRVIGTDPRLRILSLDISTSENTVFVEVSVTLQPDLSVESLIFTFDERTNNITLS